MDEAKIKIEEIDNKVCGLLSSTRHQMGHGEEKCLKKIFSKVIQWLVSRQGICLHSRQNRKTVIK